MEYISTVRTSGIETTTGNVTPIMKSTVVKLVKTNIKSAIIKVKWLEVEIPLKRFREEFIKL